MTASTPPTPPSPSCTTLYDRIIRRNWLSKDMSMENQLLPGLATSWKQVSDTEWHLKIRKGVRFHDGTPMTAQDVAFTVSPERTEMKPNAFIPTIKLTEAIDDETVRVVTKQPDPILLWRLATAMDLVPHIPFYRPAEMYGVRDCVQWEPYPLYYMDFRKENILVNCPD